MLFRLKYVSNNMAHYSGDFFIKQRSNWTFHLFHPYVFGELDQLLLFYFYFKMITGPLQEPYRLKKTESIKRKRG